MSVSTNGKMLVTVTKELLLKWEYTRGYWTDAKASEFERKYMGELQSQVDKAVEVCDHLDKLISRVRSDCE